MTAALSGAARDIALLWPHLSVMGLQGRSPHLPCLGRSCQQWGKVQLNLL